MQCMSVDFPDPDGPMTAVKRPRSNVTLMPSSARTAVCPVPYVLVRFSARAAMCFHRCYSRHTESLARDRGKGNGLQGWIARAFG